MPQSLWYLNKKFMFAFWIEYVCFMGDRRDWTNLEVSIVLSVLYVRTYIFRSSPKTTHCYSNGQGLIFWIERMLLQMINVAIILQTSLKDIDRDGPSHACKSLLFNFIFTFTFSLFLTIELTKLTTYIEEQYRSRTYTDIKMSQKYWRQYDNSTLRNK